jgi:hypothetical protein
VLDCPVVAQAFRRAQSAAKSAQAPWMLSGGMAQAFCPAQSTAQHARTSSAVQAQLPRCSRTGVLPLQHPHQVLGFTPSPESADFQCAGVGCHTGAALET